MINSRLTHPFILPELTKSVQGIRGEIIDWLCSLETVETYPYKGTLFFLKKTWFVFVTWFGFEEIFF